MRNACFRLDLERSHLGVKIISECAQFSGSERSGFSGTGVIDNIYSVIIYFYSADSASDETNDTICVPCRLDKAGLKSLNFARSTEGSYFPVKKSLGINFGFCFAIVRIVSIKFFIVSYKVIFIHQENHSKSGR